MDTLLDDVRHITKSRLEWGIHRAHSMSELEWCGVIVLALHKLGHHDARMVSISGRLGYPARDISRTCLELPSSDATPSYIDCLGFVGLENIIGRGKEAHVDVREPFAMNTPTMAGTQLQSVDKLAQVILDRRALLLDLRTQDAASTASKPRL